MRIPMAVCCWYHSWTDRLICSLRECRNLFLAPMEGLIRPITSHSRIYLSFWVKVLSICVFPQPNWAASWNGRPNGIFNALATSCVITIQNLLRYIRKFQKTKTWRIDFPICRASITLIRSDRESPNRVFGAGFVDVSCDCWAGSAIARLRDLGNCPFSTTELSGSRNALTL